MPKVMFYPMCFRTGILSLPKVMFLPMLNTWAIFDFPVRCVSFGLYKI